MAVIGDLKVYSVSELEKSLGRVSLRSFVQESEGAFLRQTQDIAWHIAWNSEIKLVLVSGPTSSGKTTFSHRLSGATRLYGRDVKVLSMDDYYLDTGHIETSYGLPDFETMKMLDLDLMSEHIARIIKGEKVQMPKFIFEGRQRVWDPEYVLQLEEKDVLLVEGLHALHPQLTERLDPKVHYGIFIMPQAHLHGDTRLLKSDDIRILRRTNRDFYHRAANAFSTLDYWPVIRDAEEEFVPIYLDRAHVYVNSALAYEYLVIPPLAAAHIRQDLERYEAGILPKSKYLSHLPDGPDYANLERVVKEAKRLLSISEGLPQVDPDIIPEVSILNEFIH